MVEKNIDRMNVAISFCGEGFGHASRISAIASELKKYHNLTFWCPKTVESFFRNNYSHGKVFNVPLLSLVKKNNKLQAYDTVKINIKNLLFNHEIIDNLAKQLLDLKIDVVISDYEPFLVKAANKLGIPVLLFNHPGIITRFKKFSINYFFSRVTANFMMPGFNSDNLIISSFYNGDVGPIIRDEIKNIVVKNEDFILVYLKTSLKDKLLPALKSLNQYNFRLFPNNNYDFVSSLANCKGVIAPAGHQLISECIYLKKPLLVIPEAGQYEQILNAEMLLKTGLGQIIFEKNISKSISNFISLTDEGFFKLNDSLINFNFNDDLQKAINKINIFLYNCNLKKQNFKSTKQIDIESYHY